VLFRERRIWRFVLSPDGKHLGILGLPYADARSSYIAIVPTFGGATRVVHSASRPRFIGQQLKAYTRLAPDGRRIAYTSLAGQNVSELSAMESAPEKR
jgi:hypothetical protein